MKKNKISFLFLLIVMTFNIQLLVAQNDLQERHRNYIDTRLRDQKTERIKIIQDISLDSLEAKHIRITNKNDGINGWRIQLYYGLSETEATQAQTELLRKYPNLWSYVQYNAPNFRTVVGNYTNEIDAYRFYKELVKDFKDCYMRKQKIKFAELKFRNWQYFESIQER